jgi:5'-deoxynucleotidase YfbR-like HD superfamily hydrolase
MIKIRASALGDIMTDAKEKNEPLSKGAKTVLEKMAKEFVYGYKEVISGKYMDKGIIVEDQSIALYNSVFFTDYKKNTERRTNDYITGECDIYVPCKKIIDIKSSWSLPTFPATAAAGADKGYEWQGRAYLMLWDVDVFEIAYCMVNTPDELIRFEQEELHYVDHIDEPLRVTIVPYERDKSLEEKIKFKVDAARSYMTRIIEEIQEQHSIFEAECAAPKAAPTAPDWRSQFATQQ